MWPFMSDVAKEAFNNSTHFLPEFDMTSLFSFTRLRGCMNGAIPPNAKDLIAKRKIFLSFTNLTFLFVRSVLVEIRRSKIDLRCLSNITSSSYEENC